MGFIHKLEKKIGKYAIPNLTRYIIFTYVIGYLIQISAGNIISYLYLDPYLILHGQVWRLVTWLLIPPQSLSIFTIIMLYFYYSIGTTLENSWGDFRYNLYIIGGIITTIIGAFLLFFLGGLLSGGGMSYQWISTQFSMAFSTYYISLSIFLGFAMTYPNMQVMLMFVIPIKIKYLAYLDILYLLYALIESDWGGRVVIVSSLLNVLIFFLVTRNYFSISPKEVRRKQVYRRQVKRAQKISKHKCAICGRTEEDGADLEFRFCSKCDGNYEYCRDHLFTHEHVKKS